jgi:hypothetical protein
MNWMRLAATLSVGLLGVHAYADDSGRRAEPNSNPAAAENGAVASRNSAGLGRPRDLAQTVELGRCRGV